MGRVMAAYNEYKKTGVSCWADGDGGISVAGIFLTPDLYEERLEILGGKAGKAFADNKAVVVLDTEVTEELVKEGMARDFVRLVQNLRKEKNFDISDRIRLCWQTDDEKLRQALRENESISKFRCWCRRETKFPKPVPAERRPKSKGLPSVLMRKLFLP